MSLTRTLGNTLCACGCGIALVPPKRIQKTRPTLYRPGHGRRMMLAPPIGKTFARLTVIGDSVKTDSGGKRYWSFQCSCGRIKDQTASRVVSGEIQSCGCLAREKQHTAVVKYPGDPLRKYRNALVSQYKEHAKHRGLDFELETGEVARLCQMPCVYCGRSNVSLASKHYKGMLPHNGIDRIDSTRGYVTGNVVTCCKTCNVMKQRMTVSEFMAHMRLVLAHMEGM